MKSLEAAGPQDCLAQPLKPEDQQQPTDEEPQAIHRYRHYRRAQCCDRHHQHEHACQRARDSRAPDT